MRPGFYAVGAGMLMTMARGWLWLGERVRAPGERPPAYQFLIALLGLSRSMAELERCADRADGSMFMSRVDSTSIAKSRAGVRRVSRLRPAAAPMMRARDARPRRRSTFRAENPRRILRVK